MESSEISIVSDAPCVASKMCKSLLLVECEIANGEKPVNFDTKAVEV